jgi:hypothetical protein
MRGNTSLARKRAREEAALANGSGKLCGWTSEDVEQLAWGGNGPFGDPASGTFKAPMAERCWRDISHVVQRSYRDELERLSASPVEPCWYELTALVASRPMRTCEAKVHRLAFVPSLDVWAIWMAPAPGVETRLAFLMRCSAVDLDTWEPAPAAVEFWRDRMTEHRVQKLEYGANELAALAILFDPDGEAELLTAEELKRARPFM